MREYLRQGIDVFKVNVFSLKVNQPRKIAAKAEDVGSSNSTRWRSAVVGSEWSSRQNMCQALSHTLLELPC